MLSILRHLFRKNAEGGDVAYLGEGKKAGEAHYRAFVGPPRDYDLIAAMCFNLLTCMGLRQQHRLLDIGCGSLRLGRLFIPYLNVGHYVGLEPNAWLVEEGIRNETGKALIDIKRPRFLFGSSPSLLDGIDVFDYALAQSIFSHCSREMIGDWLHGVARVLAPAGVLLATHLAADSDSLEQGWIYPGCVGYTEPTMRQLAQDAGLRYIPVEWRHPRQTWAAYVHREAPVQWFELRPPSWNNLPVFCPCPS